MSTGPLDEVQRSELSLLLNFLHEFWEQYAVVASSNPLAPLHLASVRDDIPLENLTRSETPLDDLLPVVLTLIERHSVKINHPLFLGYATPPSLDIASLGEALKAITNQNVMFASLSPLGSRLEELVVRWLGQMIAFPETCGGILTSGGSEANAYGIAVARRKKLGSEVIRKGNYADKRRLRLYRSTEAHGSFDKAAGDLGLGSDNVVRINVDTNHRIRIDELRKAIEADVKSREFLPLVLIGSAGTLHCCAFDDLRALRQVADEFGLWLHVDAAYGGFLRIASSPPEGAEHLQLADSVTLDPHKLLFIPFDCGSFLVRDPEDLFNCFGGAGEYLAGDFQNKDQNEKGTVAGLRDFASYGMQLGRSNRALPVWLALKRFGMDSFSREYSRLMGLAGHLRDLVLADHRYELLGPVPGTAVCFRWRQGPKRRLDQINRQILQASREFAYLTEVRLGNKTGLRACMTNYRTTEDHLNELISRLTFLASNFDQVA